MSPQSLFPRPICVICSDPAPTDRAKLLRGVGRICIECYGEHLPRATVALSEAGIFGELHQPKNNRSRITTKHPKQP